MATYNSAIVRTAGANPDHSAYDPLAVPEALSRVILQEAVKSSVILNLARVQPMTTRAERMPAIDLFPSAQWLDPDPGTPAQEDIALKQTTKMAWKNITMEAREIAIMVPVADNYVADTGFDLLGMIAPRVGEAIGAALDNACFWGINSPWSNNPDSAGIYQRCITANNHVTIAAGASPSPDVAADIAQLNFLIANQGFSVNGYASRPGFQWLLSQARTSQGLNPYSPGNGVDFTPGTLFGKPFREVENGAWDPTRADMIVGDWSKALVGVRQDVTMKVFDSGVIQDGSGAIQYNAMQQDGKILRIVARYAFATMSYKTILSPSTAAYPFGVLRTAGSPAS